MIGVVLARTVALAALATLGLSGWALIDPAASGRPALAAGRPLADVPRARRPVPEASPAPNEAGTLAWLSGPFGSVPGVPLEAGADGTPPGNAPQPGERPIDTLARGVRLSLEPGDPADGLRSWHVEARPLGGGSVLVLEAGAADGRPEAAVAMRGPDRAGDYLLVADVATDTGKRARLAWTLRVPNQPRPPDGIPDVVPPAVELVTGTTVAAGWPGDGCYVYHCVEVGHDTPPELLPVVSSPAGADLVLRLSDGSPVTWWEAEWVSTAGLTGGASEEAPRRLPEARLHTPAPGVWLLRVRVGLDRERGWLEASFRLEVS